MIEQDENYIRRCIQIAKNGLGTTYPNPLVGSVIVYKNQIIGEGWHKRAGQAHAEINAIDSVKDKTLLKESDIYVSLEPCSHYGKTPPCAVKIAELQFKRVIIGSIDPNSKVNGKGISIIKNSGIPIVTGILENECYNLNKRFFTFHIKKRPYIFLKWAETLNKKIDNGEDRDSPFWISNPYSLQKTHLIRSQEESILVGKNTAVTDNPALTCRSIHGSNPLRILIDRRLDVPESFRLYNSEAPTLIFNEKKNLKKEFTEYIRIDFSENIYTQILNNLYLRNIQSLIVEGGRQTLQNFIDNSLWDEAIITTSNTIVKNGTDSPTLFGNITHQEYINTNLITYIQNLSGQ
ncbi:bifunctional diaminohydroxyphosphoribosylaminopyrimidine deaminase/5-amino-6-(5-phosphoribosylamino)uracil reductase RibD [Apibacter raozihei]|uniref:bifunctional diaminohydroxyphosphoribosylaminopyrimidine deaminase/5-amino-6-(5-phosphoribosylamino)uracil reductase RibD n=1 Tax=Apibacter raozihei TaxID=2500547 RepID=UPI000FE3875A|nr:bifunctional diaminohydroxyphosphoribosylaminopyrimidine deaminase/5-amino-6-(5-phosphoribosylamino)uracil reductase RibD [Apibacter raozihei]